MYLYTVDIEEAESIVKRALEQEGKIKQRNMVIVITGLMGAGKTTLLNRLFGEKPPVEYTSTGTAEGSWRGLTRGTLDIKKFKLLSVDDIFKSVAPLLKQLFTKRGSTLENLSEIQEDNEVENELTQSTDEAYAPKVMARHIPRHIPEEPEEYTLEIAHMIDTGGQPECLEVIPSLIHNANLTILVVDISRHLDENPESTYHEEGNEFNKKREPLLYSNRQIIEQIAHTMCTGSSKIIVVGTHIDHVKEDSVLIDMNNYLEQVLKGSELFVKSNDEVFFPIDLEHCGDDDETINNVRKCIEGHEAEEIELPPSFVMFEYEIMKFFERKMEETRKVKVITFQECLEIGKRLKMDKTVVKAALIHFHENNIFLFFQKPQLVFLEPQVLLNFVNTIVAFSYKITKPDNKISPPLTKEQRDELEKGIFTEQLLKHRNISGNFVPGIFEAHHAIDIFENLHTIAKVVEERKTTKYIMMCLLPRLKQEEFDSKEQSLISECTLVEPLLLHFGKYCAPNGCFGRTIACLMFNKNWKIQYTCDKTPECLKHDILTLRPCGKQFKVTLVNNTKYFTVYVHLRDNHHSQYIPAVKNDIVDAINEVMTIKKNAIEEVLRIEFHEGFKCYKCTSMHFLSLPSLDDESLICEYRIEEKIPIEQGYSVWWQGKAGKCLHGVVFDFTTC